MDGQRTRVFQASRSHAHFSGNSNEQLKLISEMRKRERERDNRTQFWKQLRAGHNDAGDRKTLLSLSYSLTVGKIRLELEKTTRGNRKKQHISRKRSVSQKVLREKCKSSKSVRNSSSEGRNVATNYQSTNAPGGVEPLPCSIAPNPEKLDTRR